MEDEIDDFCLNDFWAKTDSDGCPALSVYDHCLAVGAVAQALIDRMPTRLRGMIPNCTPVLAALHDVGKITPGFQAKCDAWLKNKGIDAVSRGWVHSEARHDKVTQIYLQTRQVDLAWSVAVGAHHGRLLSRSSSPIPPVVECEKARFAAFRDELAKKLEVVLGSLSGLEMPAPPEHIRWFVAGLISVADWLGSNEKYFPLIGMGQNDQPLSLFQERAEACLRCIGWSHKSPATGLSFEELFHRKNGSSLTPCPLQKVVIDVVNNPGLYLIEGPMGCGKTEAALVAAYQLIEKGYHHGIYFGLPTQTTSNRIYQRVEKFLLNCHSNSPYNIRLVHANSWLKNDDIALGPSNHGYHWFAPSRRALLAQYGVGTIDQTLLGIVRTKHFFVRQFGLAGKVIILDEVHSYDLYTGTLIDVLIKRLLELGCTVLVLSATLTESRRRELLSIAGGDPARLSTAYPLLSGCNGNGTMIESAVEAPKPKDIAVRCVTRSAPQLAAECLDRARGGACVLWIRNTVAEAQESWRELKTIQGDSDPEIGLLHSRFPYWRREQLEEKWIEILGKSTEKRPCGCVLVSTQIVEQSVDIDADFLVTDLAPTDMLFQRMGRLWRHERSNRCRCTTHPETWIVVPNLDRLATSQELKKAFGKSSRVYAPYVLLRSHQVWSQRIGVTLPHDIRPMLERTYSSAVDRSEPLPWHELFGEIQKRRSEMKAIAESISRIEADSTLDDAENESITTRWNDIPSASLLLIKKMDRIDRGGIQITPLHGQAFTIYQDDKRVDVARAIHENLVRLPHWSVSNACSQRPEWLAGYVQGYCAVATVETGGVVFADGNSSADLSWDVNEGVVIRPRSKTKKNSNMDCEDEPCE